MAESEAGTVQALVDFAASGTYPNSLNYDAELLPEDAVSARAALAKAGIDARAQITKISRSVGPDVDAWIAQAQQLQQDIEHSKAIAREVVKEARQAEELRAAREETSRKAGLLQLEVEYNQKLQASLRHAKDAGLSLGKGQEALQDGGLDRGLDHLIRGEERIAALAPLGRTTAVVLLHERATRLRERLEEEAVASWNKVVSFHGSRIVIEPGNQVASIFDLLSTLHLAEPSLHQLSRNLDQCIITPRLRRRAGSSSARIVCRDTLCELTGNNSNDGDESLALLEDLTSLVSFLNDKLPAPISMRVSEDVMPSLLNRLITDCLHESIPTALNERTAFEVLLKAAQAFTEHLANIGWLGGAELNDWIEQAPKEWLTRRRETALISVRDCLAKGVKVTKQVERVETQLVSKAEVMPHAGNDDSDDWGAAWGDDDHVPAEPKVPPSVAEDDDEDGSAWDMGGGDEGAEPLAVTMGTPHPNGNTEDISGNGEDAWGWEEQHSPVATKHLPVAKTNGVHASRDHDTAQERQITLREKFTVTAIPDELLSYITQCLSDAADLQGDSFNDSTIQPAAVGLYSIPTLILAGYRSLAPSFYTLIAGGNMFLYNDCMQLNSSLEALAAELEKHNPAALRRVKLQNDIEALTSFGKRAYGKEMESQRTILRDLLDGAQGFTNCTEAPYARECDNAVSMTLDRLRTVATEWKPILSHSALMQSMGSLLNTVVNKVLIDILDLSDISAEESAHLRELCDKIGTLSDIFTGPATTEDGQPSDMTAIYTPDWFRFQYLGEILESNLADIKYMWQEEGLKLEFEANEVVDLVEALFADSDRRRQAIAEIRRG